MVKHTNAEIETAAELIRIVFAWSYAEDGTEEADLEQKTQGHDCGSRSGRVGPARLVILHVGADVQAVIGHEYTAGAGKCGAGVLVSKIVPTIKACAEDCRASNVIASSQFRLWPCLALRRPPVDCVAASGDGVVRADL